MSQVKQGAVPEFASWPVFAEDERAAVEQVLTSGQVNYWTGSRCHDFELAFAAQMGCEYAVAVSNGTQALELALRALDIGEGDEVIVPARTFVATAAAVLAVGALPIFADVDPVSQNLTVEALGAVVTERTSAVIAVHLAGWPCALDELLDFTSAHKLWLIEDCAQAHGAAWQGRPVGSWGQIGCWSFCQDKILTTGGEGGMLTTQDESLFKRLWSLKDHGKNLDLVQQTPSSLGFRWLHTSWGTNARMTEMQAAIGLQQLQKLPQWQQQRWQNLQFIWQAALQSEVFQVPDFPVNLGRHAAYKAYVQVRPERLKNGWSRDRILQELLSASVPCFTGACPEVYREAVFKQLGLSPAAPLPQAQLLGRTSLMFLCHPGLNQHALNYLSDQLQRIAGLARR